VRWRCLACSTVSGTSKIKSIRARDLQVGDHLTSFEGTLYNSITDNSAARALRTLVMDVESNPYTDGASVRSSRTRFQGPDTYQRHLADFLRHDAVADFNNVLEQAQFHIYANPNATVLSWNGITNFLMRWDPYEGFRSPGAWWVRFNIGHFFYSTLAEALEDIPGAFIHDPNAGSVIVRHRIWMPYTFRSFGPDVERRGTVQARTRSYERGTDSCYLLSLSPWLAGVVTQARSDGAHDPSTPTEVSKLPMRAPSAPLFALVPRRLLHKASS
jgi:hypothetical protein